MKTTISGKHIEIGESLRAHIESRIKEVISHYVPGLLEAHVVISKNSFQFLGEISLHVSHNFVVRAHADDADAYKCIDSTFTKLGSRLKRYKSRLKDRKRHPEPIETAWSAQKYTIDKETETHGEENPLIIAEMPREINTLSVSEAVMRMDLCEASILMFRNPKDGQFNVVYRREDGNIGWIAPDQNNKLSKPV